MKILFSQMMHVLTARKERDVRIRLCLSRAWIMDLIPFMLFVMGLAFLIKVADLMATPTSWYE